MLMGWKESRESRSVLA
ncbi:unnamed protein product, partial [Rotaria sp. Silwood2]